MYADPQNCMTSRIGKENGSLIHARCEEYIYILSLKKWSRNGPYSKEHNSMLSLRLAYSFPGIPCNLPYEKHMHVKIYIHKYVHGSLAFVMGDKWLEITICSYDGLHEETSICIQ